MLDTSVRLLELLSLFTSRRYWTGSELATRLEITERTLRRDVDRLRQLGYPIASTSGVAGGYHLAPGRSLPPLQLDREEALAVALGLRTAATSSVAGTVEAATRALTKLERLLPSPVRRKVEALSAAIAPLDPTGPIVNAQILGTLASACQDKELVELSYTDRAGADTVRNVEPHGLACLGSRWYLAAWDRGREDFRTFRLDRIGAVRLRGKTFLGRSLPGGSVTTYVLQSVSHSGQSSRARIVFRAPLEEVARRVPASVGILEQLDDSRCLLETTAYSLERVVLHAALLGFEFDIAEPPELKLAARQFAERLRRAAGVSSLEGIGDSPSD